ncbi:hypothetical protein PVAG01_10076 [Phlyctema vagabunda]|uniref:DEAD/DEAH box helicase n=1 Tax=Phlyctema vagabunda TaxID=108571 RepID=A0ABR4P4X9_9HELO
MPPSSRGWLGVFQRWKSIHSSDFLTRSSIHYATSAAPSTTQRTVVRLRQYQEECIQAVLSHLKGGHKRLGVSLATGSGKTVIFTQLIDRVPPRNATSNQTLILAHRQELVEQAARHCTNAYPDKRVEIEMGNMHSSGSAEITVASIQSIISGDRISKFDPSRFKLVLVDEAHHIVAPGYLRTLDYFGLEEKRADSPALVGVSATLSRFDGLRLGAAIDQIVYHKDYIDMIGEKWLSDVIFTTVQTKADISKVKKGANGDFAPAELSRAVNTDEVNEITLRSWFAKAKDRKATLAFCVDLTHVAGLTNTFRKHGIDARFVTGDTPKPERSARLDSFRNGEFPVLVNCGVFTEGTDIPNIDCVLLARPTKSRNLLVQMIGRGMRLHPGKKDCHIIDMVASLETGIVTVPTLFGLDPSEVVETANPDDMKSMLDAKESEAQNSATLPSGATKKDVRPVSNKVVFTDYDNVFDLIEDMSGELHIRAISPHAWVNVAQDKYVLSSSDGSHVKIEKVPLADSEEHEFLVISLHALSTVPKVPNTKPFAKPRVLTRSLNLTDAVHAADTFAASKYPFKFISQNQLWRKQPATDGQLIFLNKLRPKTDPLTPEDITKGKAGDMITKIKHGARGRFAVMEAGKKREERARVKKEHEIALKKREQVSVGPLLE